MLRPFRASDIPSYMDLYRRHFPEESEVLRTDPDGFRRTLERGFSPAARIVLGALSLFGRPVLEFLADEEDGRLAGATFLFYLPRAGYISSVVVDTPYRGRGLARAMMAETERRILRRHRSYALLDVIATNEPARRLYGSLGYRLLRRVGWFVLDRPDGEGSPEAPGPGAGSVRAFQRADGAALAEMARARQPAEDRAVRPIGPEAFRLPPVLARVFGSTSAAFVLDGPKGPRGFARATSAGVMASGHLVPPLVADAVREEEAEALLTVALGFFRSHPVPRIVAEVPLDDPAGVRRLEGRGFRLALTLEALVKPVDA